MMIIADQFRKMVLDGMELPNAIQWLHEMNVSKVSSIELIVNNYDVDLSDAKTLVHRHDVWKNSQELDERFHDDLFKRVVDK